MAKKKSQKITSKIKADLVENSAIMPHPLIDDAFIVSPSIKKGEGVRQYILSMEEDLLETQRQFSSGLDVYNKLLPKELRLAPPPGIVTGKQ